jgi:hypothetical protein
VIAGKHDSATLLEGNEFICQHIPGARIAVLEAAHIANFEPQRIYADKRFRMASIKFMCMIIVSGGSLVGERKPRLA